MEERDGAIRDTKIDADTRERGTFAQKDKRNSAVYLDGAWQGVVAFGDQGRKKRR